MSNMERIQIAHLPLKRGIGNECHNLYSSNGSLAGRIYDPALNTAIVEAANNHARLTAENAALARALRATQDHLAELSVMIRDQTLHRWNSAGTVKTIQEARDLLTAIDKERK